MRNDYIYDDGGRHQYFQMKYKKDYVGDCVVRALTLATGENYQEVRRELWWTSYKNGDMPNEKRNYEEFLKKRGFIKEKKIAGFTLGHYPISHKDTYVVVLANHLVCLDQGLVRDTWDCRYKSPYSVWRKP